MQPNTFRQCSLALSSGEQPNWDAFWELPVKEREILFALMSKLNDIDVLLGYMKHSGKKSTHVIPYLHKQPDYMFPKDMTVKHWDQLEALHRKEAVQGELMLIELLIGSAVHHDRADMMQWITYAPEMNTMSYALKSLFLDTLDRAVQWERPKVAVQAIDMLINQFETDPNELKRREPDAFAAWEKHVLLQHTASRSVAPPKLM